ncbi:RNA polymerase sigma-70 factor [Chitinophaga polysaccharea]|uniref:RNA polymerase sigma-70 factor n=1 Tax=Chitinophaga TaxID=79328 RepID=UPI001455BDBE|nr:MULTISPECIES: RNA polymerase sigma-70 factor [Chitinophaga]NLR61725.1 RNA polymerase sigma-70 factor [Chitinophaga polysaccharea]NLU92583.1 RNA polymerase sigma-70 factor [Chitinophaga sp. Ak27]
MRSNYSAIKPKSYHTDLELIALFKQGESQAFDRLYERHFIRLVNIAYKKTGHLEASQELAQDVFISLYKQLPALQPATVLENYLFVALKNRILNYHRQQLAKLKKEKAFIDDMPVTARENNSQLELKELEARLQARIQQLPTQCRAVFLLSRENQLSNKEVAERLNISVNTVEQHMRKALRLLRASLGNDLAVLLLWMMMKK